jgi:phosphoserine phosphatase RsbU/P
MAIVNDVLVEQPRLSLVTVVCALLEERDGGSRMTTAVGGHPLPLLKRGSTVTPVGRTGRLLGVEGEAAWDQHVVDVLPGDTLLFFTDGVIDTPGERQRFGERRLHDVLVDAPADPLALLERVESTLDAFQHGDRTDDRAMLALRYAGAAAERGSDVPDGSAIAA